jgi:hypothetical protein
MWNWQMEGNGEVSIYSLIIERNSGTNHTAVKIDFQNVPSPAPSARPSTHQPTSPQ